MKIMLLLIMLFSLLSSQEYPTAYGSCIGCHGLEGEKNTLVTASRPNTLTKTEIIDALNGYKLAKRNIYGRADMMQPFAKKLTPSDILIIADYLAK